jgi:hypothetical protein
MKEFAYGATSILRLAALTYAYMYLEYYSSDFSSYCSRFARETVLETIANHGTSIITDIAICLFHGGYIISLVFIYLLPSTRRLVGFVFLGIEALMRLLLDSDSYRISLFIYWILHLFPSCVKEENAAKVVFRPFEPEIRQFLFLRCPEKLHLVDSLLERYGFDGEALLGDLKEEFEVKEAKKRESLLRNLVHR